MSLIAGVLDSQAGHATITGQTVHGHNMRAFSVAAGAVSTAWPLANDAYLIPFEVAVPTRILEIFFVAGTTPGTTNYDLGIYNDKFARIVSLGATACVNTTDKLLPDGGGDIADVTLTRGRYYMAMSAAAITLNVRANVNVNGFMRSIGMFKMAAAHPLPATFTPASMGATNFMPVMGIATVTNLL